LSRGAVLPLPPRGGPRDLRSFPTRRSSDLPRSASADVPDEALRRRGLGLAPGQGRRRGAGGDVAGDHVDVAGPEFFDLRVVLAQIGRAHVCTPVTFRYRMPSSA